MFLPSERDLKQMGCCLLVVLLILLGIAFGLGAWVA